MPPLHPGSEAPIERFSRAVREVMVGLGFQEVNNYMMTNKRLLYSMMGLPEQPTVEVENPRHEAYSCLRTWLLPQLLQTLSRSRHAAYPQRIFEVGDVAAFDRKSSFYEEREGRKVDRRIIISPFFEPGAEEMANTGLGFESPYEDELDTPAFLRKRSSGGDDDRDVPAFMRRGGSD